CGVPAASSALVAAPERVDVTEARAAFERVGTAAARLPADHPLRRNVEQALAFGKPLLDGISAAESAEGMPPPDGYLAMLERAAAQPDLADGERTFYRTRLSASEMLWQQDLGDDRLDATVARLRQVVADTGPDDPQRAHSLLSLAFGLVRRAEATGAAADLSEAGRLLEEAYACAGGPGDPK